MKIQSFFCAALLLLALFTSCSKDSEQVNISQNTKLQISDIKAHSVSLTTQGSYDANTHTYIITKKSDGAKVYSSNAMSATNIASSLESLTTYVLSLEVEGYEKTPYETIEFTTKLTDYFSIFNSTTKMGAEVKIETNISPDTSIEDREFFLVDINDSSDKTKLKISRDASELTFKLPEDLMATESPVYYRDFIIQYTSENNTLEELGTSLGDNQIDLRVFYDKMKLYKFNYARKEKCEGNNEQFSVVVEGFFHNISSWNVDHDHVSVLIKNLDNGKELEIQGDTGFNGQDCTRFTRDPAYSQTIDYKAFNQMSISHLRFRFAVDEANGMVEGNYSVKLVYYDDTPDSVEVSNTFEFVIEE